MALILDTDNEILIAENAAGMAAHLIELLDEEPDDYALAKLAAAVLGCDALDVIITRTGDS